MLEFNEDEFEHIVRGCRNIDGRWELIAPQFIFVKKGWFKFIERQRVSEKLNRLSAVKIAKQAFNSGKYQDVEVIRDNGGYDGMTFCPTIIYDNGKWCDVTLNRTSFNSLCE